MDRVTKMNDSLMLLNSFLAPEASKPANKSFTGANFNRTMMNETTFLGQRSTERTMFMDKTKANFDFTIGPNSNLDFTVAAINSTKIQDEGVMYDSCYDKNDVFIRLNKAFADILFSRDYTLDGVDKLTQVVAALDLELRSVSQYDKSQAWTDLLLLEQSTWKLILALLRDRSSEVVEEMELDPIMRSGYSEQVIVDQMFARNRGVRELQVVIDWLENIARVNSSKNIPHNFYYYENSILAWNQGDERAFHPDIPTASPELLHAGDKENLNAFMKCAFHLVRAGELEALRNVAFKFGHGWLISCLEGRRLYHDPNFEINSSPSDQLCVVGNKNRLQWKRICAMSARNKTYNKYQRALFGLFCGDLQSLLVVCHTWQDKLWAYLKCLLDELVEQEISLYRNSGNDMDVELDLKTTEEVFRRLEADCLVSQPDNYFFFQIQKAFILNDTQLLRNITTRKEVNKNSKIFSRFSCTLSLILADLELIETDADFDLVVQNGVNDLISLGQHSLVCLYMPHLIDPVSFYCRFLNSEVDADAREDYIALANEQGLDTGVIRSQLINSCKGSYIPQHYSEDATSEELLMIDSLARLKSDSNTPAQFLYTANSVIRVFLSGKRLMPLWQVLGYVSTSIVDEIVVSYRRHDNSAIIPARETNIIKEYICLKACIQAYTDLQHSQTAVSSGSHVVSRVLNQGYEVLKFTGGWLIDEQSVDHYFGEEDERSRQMELLRKLMIPELVFRMLTLIRDSSQFDRCSEVLNCVMDEQWGLFELFDDSQLELLDSLCIECSSAILDSQQSLV